MESSIELLTTNNPNEHLLSLAFHCAIRNVINSIEDTIILLSIKGESAFTFQYTIEIILHSKVPVIDRWVLTDCLLFLLSQKSP